jgi:hypothetical protein
MATTNTLLRILTVSQNYKRNAPLTGVGGNPIEPSASIGDWVRGFILSPPFAWRWNRAVATFTTTASVQDYVKAIPSFGWLESATVSDGTTTWGMEITLSNPEDKSNSLPRFVAARLDDDAGNITFRIHPAPDAVYTVTLTYQLAAPTFVTLADTWSPIPDYMYNVYSQGFLSKVYEYFDDPRAIPAFQLFLRSLLSASEGLDESQKRIFAADFLNTSRMEQSAAQTGQLARQGRSGM